MTIVSSCTSLSRGRIGNGYTKRRIAGIKTPAARVSRTADFRRAHLQPIMMPVHVDTASANAVAAKNIFVGSELGVGGACVGLEGSSF